MEYPAFDAKLIDGPVLVYKLTPGKFNQYISIEKCAFINKSAFIYIYMCVHTNCCP